MMVHWIQVSVFISDHVLEYCTMFMYTGVVKAFDQAWQWDKANCATYYR